MKQSLFKSYFNRPLFLFAIFCCCSLYAAAQTATKPAAPAKKTAVKAPASKGAVAIIDTFFKKYKNDGTSPAIDFLFETNILFTDAARITLLKVKLDSLRQSIGGYIGKELISQKSAGNSLVLYSYLVKHDNQPIRFTFMFYKAKDDWILYRFKYDDQMDLELEDAGKINMKRP
jgi:hypothetical protein